ncbi:MAG: GNAT family N-acetyltransferase [Proteobacteria bacterium]|nr:GNAT family N-acetyltransferase [Pseudomonadota bacterium]
MNEATPRIRHGSQADLSAIESLLQSAGLPADDIRGIPGLLTWVVEAGGTIQGAIALEPFGKEGLLRSLVVAPDARRHGLGRNLVMQLESDASSEGVRTLVLLTQTAAPFFRDLGYQAVGRDDVSSAVKSSAQFRSLCPASATCMSKILV